MAGPTAQPILVSAPQQAVLEGILRAHTSPQALVHRTQIILAAATDDHNTPIARRLGCTRLTVRKWRSRWAAAQAALAAAEGSAVDLRAQIATVLADAQRSGRPDTFTAEQIVHIVALACTPPADAGCPVEAWTPRELADRAVAQGIVPAISPRSVERFLKSGRSATAPQPLLAQHEGA
jgi:hypothetical protein